MDLRSLRAAARWRLRQAARGAARRLLPQWTVDWAARALPGISRRPTSAVELPPGRRVLVLAPHADDETIGCGGTMLKYRQSGASVCVTVMTDGSQAGAVGQLPRGSLERAEAERVLLAERKAEAWSALEELAVTDVRFLDGPDGSLDPTSEELQASLCEVLQEIRPEVVFLPFISDRHTDHLATNECLVAVHRSGRLPWLNEVQCCAYEVWAPLPATLVVDITAQLPQKRQALEKYQSQMGRLSYVDAVLGLNRYRAVSSLSAGQYAEAFYLAPIGEYRQLLDRLHL